MLTHDWETLLEGAKSEALRFLQELPGREIRAPATLEELREGLGGLLPEAPSDPREVVAELAKAADRGLLASASGRFFGFVMGGALPASVGAEWLTAAWDQCAGFHALSPAAAVAEQAVVSWLLKLLGLPPDASVGFVTGAQMANFTGLAAGRDAVLRRAGWDVETDGLVGAPPLTVVVGRERHVTVDRALRFLGLGTACLREVEADGQGRMRPDALAGALRGRCGPAIVCAQVGNINTGALDPVGEICKIAHERGAWVHVDGAFGLWAALHSLGASGVAELVDRCCALARRFADALAGTGGVRVLNDVVLNQVLVRFGDDDDLTRRVIAAVQREGTCWMGGATWRGMQVMRISVSNWSTDEDDVDRSVDAVLRCYGR